MTRQSQATSVGEAPVSLSVPAGWRLIELVVVCLLYFAAGKAGLAVPYTSGNVSPVWPAAGVALAAFLLCGYRVWPAITTGAFLVNYFSPIPHFAALGIAVGNTAGPIIGAALLKRQFSGPIHRFRDALRFLAFGVLAGTAVSALLGTSTLFLTGVHAWRNFPSAALMWWLGDATGVLLVCPLITNIGELRLPRRKIAEFLALLVSLLLGAGFLFREVPVTEQIFGFALLPLIIWGAVRFGVAGAALSSCTVSAFAVWQTAHGSGPFVRYGIPLFNAGVLQAFIAALSLSGLFLAAAIAERQGVEEALAREENLRRAEEQYRRIVETTNDGVWILDQEYRTTFVNRRMADLLGYNVEEMTGRSLLEFMFPEDIASKRGELARRRQGWQEVIYNRYRRCDGSELWALVSTAPLFNGGEFVGALGMVCDVTGLRKAEETLRQTERLVSAARMAATISHEINNPMEAALNLLYLLRHEPLSDQGQQYLRLAERELVRVSAISKRTLGFFRDTASPTAVALTDILDQTLAVYEHKFSTYPIKVIKDYRTQAPVQVLCSEIQQVFVNLVSNALDAMGNAGVLTVRVAEAANNGVSGLRADIADTGPGIAEADLKRIFEPFFTTKANTGTGLGLWVAKEIVEKHGGRLSVASRTENADHGTEFSVFLPFSTRRAASTSSSAA